MSKEEIFDEFIKVTHIDRSKIENYYPIMNLAIDGEVIADDFEGIIVKLKGKSDLMPITYFHRPYLGERGTH
jgi:hypothetical protein